MLYQLLADLIVAVHVAYVAGVVLGQVAILLGVALQWRWVRNPWLRCMHLMMIAIVAVEAILEIPCPLTVWENELRALGGGQGYPGDFVGQLLHGLIFQDLEYNHWIYPVLYLSFAALVLLTFWLAPPCWRGTPPRQDAACQAVALSRNASS